MSTSNMLQSVDLWYKDFVQQRCLKNRKYHRYLMSLIVTLAAINLTAADQEENDKKAPTCRMTIPHLMEPDTFSLQKQIIQELLDYPDWEHLPEFIAESLRRQTTLCLEDKETLTFVFCNKMLSWTSYTRDHRILALKQMLLLENSSTLFIRLIVLFSRMKDDIQSNTELRDSCVRRLYTIPSSEVFLALV